MKKIINNSCIVLLLCFSAFACSKESDEVTPTASLSSESIDNATVCKPPVEGICVYSQGRYFNAAGRGPGAGWQEVWVGEARLVEGYSKLGQRMTDADRAIMQAATLILSASEQGVYISTIINALPPDVKEAYNCIIALNVSIIEDGECSASKYKQYADTISKWIDANKCED